MAYDPTWLDTLTDEKYRVVYEHPDIIKCIECEFNCGNYKEICCSNIASYPIMPSDYGCKNGRLKKDPYEQLDKYNIIDKIKCKLGIHKAVWLGVAQPYKNEVLERCDCCGKYGLWKANVPIEIWFKRKDREKHLSKSCIEMMDKYRL